ncbi:MAG: urease accessory protein UreD [Pseudomonadota bacterium]
MMGPQLDLTFAQGRDGRSRLLRRSCRYPWSLTRPFWIDPAPVGMATVIPQSSCSILLDGDCLRQSIRLEQGAEAHLASQGAQVVHRGDPKEPSRVDWQLKVGAGAILELLWDPPILLPGAHMAQCLDITLAPGARLLLAEGLAWHPDAASPAFHAFESRVGIRDNAGRLLAVEESRITPEALRRGGCPPLVAIVTVWALGAVSAGFSQDVRGLLRAWPDAYGAVTELPNAAGLLVRALCLRSTLTRQLQEAIWRALREDRYGVSPPDRRRGR